MTRNTNYLRCIVLMVLTFYSVLSFAQSTGTKGLEIQKDATQQPEGKTYALIVGISRYQYPTCYPTLHYADVDAKALYNFLTSKTGGNVDPANVDTLFNEGATQEIFWGKFNSIRMRLQKNDNFYVYFSGHGDAISTELAYLLAYNAPPGNDRNNYYASGGVIDIHTLKGLIRMITLDKNKPAHVILITDACRSNELPPGKEEGRQQFFEEMYTKNAGEIQLVSCLANQVSFEDAKWGGGRGLFSWHLVNGMRGMADNKPEDGIVTLKELITYVSDKVQEDSYDPTNKKYRQTPDYCCRDKDDVVLAHVDKPSKDKLAMELKTGTTVTDAPAYAINKGVNLGEEMRNEGYADLYNKFITAINEDKLIAPENNNAMRYLNELLQKNIKPELKSELKFAMGGSLMSDVTKVINDYLKTGIDDKDHTTEYFMDAARKLSAFQTISDTLYYPTRDIIANKLFLEVHSKLNAGKNGELKEYLKKIDSAIALKPNAAYLYNLKGLILCKLKRYDDADATFVKGIALAPRWAILYDNRATAYIFRHEYDSALHYFSIALALDTNCQSTYEGIASVYSTQRKMDPAVHYMKLGVAKDVSNTRLWNELAYFYCIKNDLDSALYCVHRSIGADGTRRNAYGMVFALHMQQGKYPDSVAYYKNKIISFDPTNPIVYKDLGETYYDFKQDSLALEMFEQSLRLDSTNAAAWLDAAYSYDRLDEYKQAEKCLLTALRLDSLNAADEIYNRLGNAYHSMHDYKKSIRAYANAIRINPDNAVFYSNYAGSALQNGDTVAAELYYRKAIEKKPTYASAYYRLSKLLASKSQTNEAIAMLEKAVKYGKYTRSELENEEAFTALLENVAFKELLNKMD